MDVIGGAADRERGRIEAFAYAGQVGMESIATLGIDEKRLPMLCRKNDVNVDLHERLGHESLLWNLFEVHMPWVPISPRVRYRDPGLCWLTSSR